MAPITCLIQTRSIHYICCYIRNTVAQLVKNPPAMRETRVPSRVGKIPWRRNRLPIPVFLPGEFHELYSPWGRKELDTTEQFSLSLSRNISLVYRRRICFCSSWSIQNRLVLFEVCIPRWCSDEEAACNAGDTGLIPGSGRSPGEGNGNPLQYSCLGNAMDRGAWRAAVHGVTNSRT